MSSANSSLRPAWQHRGGTQSGGRGFQPPPMVASERTRSSSFGAASSEGSSSKRDVNKFAVLDDDEEAAAAAAAAAAAKPDDFGLKNSRSEGLRSVSGRIVHNPGGKTGRSLADLAARAPENVRTISYTGGATPASRFSGLRSESFQDPYKESVKVVRFTREKLLSMRPSPAPNPPECLAEFESGPMLSNEPQDPVCYDTLDADTIWATVPRDRRAPKAGGIVVEEARRPVANTRREGGPGMGPWRRGVALPPADQANKNRRDRDAENPSDLWDDPQATEAAMDFSAFGGMLDDDVDGSDIVAASDAFDLEKMAEVTRKFDEEIHGDRSRASSDADVDPDDLGNGHSVKVDPKRPLATIGTTIRSGSGNEVSVFEDFEDPAIAAAAAAAAAADDASVPESAPVPIKSANEDHSASSKLMAMIGVTREPETSNSLPSAWGVSEAVVTNSSEGSIIPLNPWGTPLLPTPEPVQGLDVQARLRQAAQDAEMELKAREAALLQRRQQQEEVQRRASLVQQQEERARQALQQQQQQQAGVQSQVEIVLMERISGILELTWGRSDLVSILTALHAEDTRVVPLLGNVAALRALILRNPRRIALRQEPGFGTEMAHLLLTNAQWQQQMQAMAQQEQLQRREQQRLLEEREKAAALAQQRQPQQKKIPNVIPGSPWYYSDPQANIQGPFRPEEMRQWLEAGYFKGDLPISQNQNGPFLALSVYFPDLSNAFYADDGVDEEAEEKARLDAERMERAKAEAEAHAKAKEAAERERLANEAAVARERQERLAEERAAAEAKKADSNGKNESLAQLKILLGVPAQAPAAPVPNPEPHLKRAESAPKAAEKRSPKTTSTKPKSDPPKTPKESTATAVPQLQPASRSVSAPAWGKFKQPAAKKSMSEIQQEEARRAAAAMQQGGGRSGSGWANVAAGRGSAAWSEGAGRPTAAAVVAPVPQTAPPVQVRAQVPPVPAVPAAIAPAPRPAQRSISTPVNTAVEDFGAKMSPVLEKWCKEQLQRLNGSTDLTLVSFCMTLSDPVEIRQYITQYLGTTPLVSAFATEFINRKGGGKPKQDEWETTATGKKNKKKKAGAR